MPAGKLKLSLKKWQNEKTYLTISKQNFINHAMNIDDAFNSNFQRKLIASICNNEDFKYYLLAAGKLGKHMQKEIVSYITGDRLSNTGFRSKYDPMYKNILKRQNLSDLVFKSTCTFDGQNPIIGSLLSKTEIGKKDSMDDLIKKNPMPSKNPFFSNIKTLMKAFLAQQDYDKKLLRNKIR